MNNIKFRAWDRQAKKMYQLDSIICSPTLSAWVKDERQFDRLLADGESAYFMQSTKMFDENGKEVYEGDLLEVWMGFEKQDSLAFVGDLRLFYFDCNRDETYYRITKYIVVGNEFENPELMGYEKVTP